VTLLGTIATPATAYLVRRYKADAGVMISASHNPYEDNGIKFFGGNGFKLSDSDEDELEERVKTANFGEPAINGGIGTVDYAFSAAEDYIRFAVGTCGVDLRGMRVMLDCANGSASTTAAEIFKRLGAKCTVINDKPNGVNINDKCGSTDLAALAEATVANRCAIGLAFDGDADRCLAVDETGEVLDGDRMMAAFAIHMKDCGTLKNDALVVTSMSNLGLSRAADARGISIVTTKVGDRYVLEEMLSNGYNLGGEQSGHILLLDYNSTGDGQVTGVQLLQLLHEKQEKASYLMSVMERFPQLILNVNVSGESKQTCLNDAEVAAAVEQAEDILGKNGRVVVRASGTEALVRVMIEGKDFNAINKLAVDIAGVIEKKYGG